MAHPILITRPGPGAEALAQALRNRLGSEAQIVISPVMRIEPVASGLSGLTGARTLLLTSANAIGALDGQTGLQGLPCYCVGAATAQAARAAGLDARDGGGTADALARTVIAETPPQPLLYLRGEHVASDLAGRLNAAGLETKETIVYRQVAQKLDPDAISLLSGAAPVILPLFSARSARLFFEDAPGTAPLRVAAISRTVADAIPQDRAQSTVIADEPTFAAMLDLIEALASAPNPVESGSGPK